MALFKPKKNKAQNIRKKEETQVEDEDDDLGESKFRKYFLFYFITLSSGKSIYFRWFQ